MSRNGAATPDINEEHEQGLELTLDTVPAELIALLDECVGLEKVSDEMNESTTTCDTDTLQYHHIDKISDCSPTCKGRIATLPSYVVELKTDIGWIRVKADTDCLTGLNA
ncbi:hypothetical protein FOL47_000408, partial [Perkinsus chesapeaki]